MNPKTHFAPMLTRLWRGGALIGAALIISPSAAQASEISLIDDANLYVTAPLRWDGRDWLYAGGAVLAIGVAHHYDEQVRTHFMTNANANSSGDPHSTRDALPTLGVVAATWAFAYVTDDRAGYHETGLMVEAAGLSVATSLVLKTLIGRERPNETSDSNGWFKHSGSFPSNHVTAAFAVGTVLAESGGDDFRWVRRGLGYGLGLATAYQRLHDNQHWLSDTVAGAALGAATARFVLKQHTAHVDALMITPEPGGLAVNYSRAFH